MSDISSDLASLKIDHEKPSGGGSRGGAKGAVFFVLLLVALGLLGAGYVWAWPVLEAKIFRTSVEITEVAVVSPAQARVTLTATGYVAAERSSKIAPKVPGRVMQVFVTQGQNVKAGEALFEMDSTDEQAMIAAARSRVAAAHARAASSRAQVGTAEAHLKQARQQAERERRLASEGLSSSGVAEDLEAQAAALKKSRAAAASVARAAAAEVHALNADVKVLETNLGNLKLFAPISGKVMNKPPEVGEFVGPQPAGVSVDMGGIELADFETLVVETDVPEQRLHLVQLGGPTEIVLDAFPQRRLRGKTLEVTPKVDRAKATIQVKVAFVDKHKQALPEMSARVSFLSEALDAQAVKQPPKTIVPRVAIVERNGATVVFAVEDDRVRMELVELGPAFGRGFELKQGPRPGTRLVKSPPSSLLDGHRIKEKSLQ